MDESRKKFLMQLGSGLLIAGLQAQMINATTEIDGKDFTGEGAADDEKFWKRIAKKYYEVSDDYINLENGYYGIQPKPVLNAFLKNVVIANSQLQDLQEKISLV